ncbi:hypothetical protein GCM10012288_12630 [Malaciobacter pacificus]|uniref:Uncharacterized protein n=1 Tax=Malaciobacter pacificus TaxID=1080223 RepID=A0A5C2H9A7_9BACT|nr:hypothetical protein [Malaciobacter pacificus]QEP34055.1 hypothetical protein APAC_0918 [Malaciobacter pacificus]GGD40067.1 hypothetical protein GCM10012288_12630 [Malaciobacter pacificus]
MVLGAKVKYINIVESISVQRERYILKKREISQSSILKYYNHTLKKYISKKKSWREKREEYYANRALRFSLIKKKSKRKIRKSKLLLPNKSYKKPY